MMCPLGEFIKEANLLLVLLCVLQISVSQSLTQRRVPGTISHCAEAL